MRLFKLALEDGVTLSGNIISRGIDIVDPLWDITKTRDDNGFGIGVCENPIHAFSYLPPTLYTELYEVESLGEKKPIFPGFWRCESIKVVRKLGFSEIDSFSNDKFIATTRPNHWAEVNTGQIGYSFGEGQIVSKDGTVYCYDTSKVFSRGKSFVEARGDSIVIAIDNSLVYHTKWVNVVLDDNAVSRRI